MRRGNCEVNKKKKAGELSRLLQDTKLFPLGYDE
jgi:hypothetical protein